MDNPNLPPPPGRQCPNCGGINHPSVERCGFCGWFPGAPLMRPPPAGSDMEGLGWILPVNDSGWSIASGYLGLFSCFPLAGVAALITGIVAMRTIKRTPGLGGKRRAITGIVLGGLGTIFWLALLGWGLVEQMNRGR